MEFNINIEKFLNQFEDEYDFLYNSNNYVAGYNEAVQAFDDFLKKHTEFVREFVNYREDFISSDREAAAFMFAFDKFI